jgi:cation diffusion facilitator family transporter
MATPMTPEAAEREKRSAALSSVIAAILLTLLKLGVGLATNSLGMLSEALHSGFDLLAAGLTFFAVRYASLPPDAGHPYGHGKMENLSALVEALLLLITCCWIVWEAVDRLFFHPEVVVPSVWAAGVLLISLVVDFSRSRMLKRMAEKHRSQALEADALHFSTDIFASLVVLAGLGALSLASVFPEDSLPRLCLERADSLAALGVSAIVVRVSCSLGQKAISVLLDAGDTALTADVRAALGSLPGITGIRDVRLRHSGPDLLVDIAISVDSALVLDETRQLRQEVEAAVRGVAEHAVMRVEITPDDAVLTDRIVKLRGLAAACGLSPHAVEFFELVPPTGEEKRQLVELHVELPPQYTLEEAHTRVDMFEERLRGHVPGIIVVTRLEPRNAGNIPSPAVHLDAEYIRSVAGEVVAGESTVDDCHNVLLRACGDGLYASFHCRMAPETTVAEAHRVALRLQTALRKRMPELMRVIVHMEPLKFRPVARDAIN